MSNRLRRLGVFTFSSVRLQAIRWFLRGEVRGTMIDDFSMKQNGLENFPVLSTNQNTSLFFRRLTAAWMARLRCETVEEDINVGA